MTSPSPTSAGMSRRVALGATGAGVLAALTACASDIRWLTVAHPALLLLLQVRPKAHPRVPRLALQLLLLPASPTRAL